MKNEKYTFSVYKPKEGLDVKALIKDLFDDKKIIEYKINENAYPDLVKVSITVTKSDFGSKQLIKLLGER